jgi:gas vesicle protein
MRKLLNFLLGMVFGAFVGGVVGLLLAPYSGGELQERIREEAQALIQKGQEAATAKRVEMETQLEAFKQGQPIVLQKPPTSGAS